MCNNIFVCTKQEQYTNNRYHEIELIRVARIYIVAKSITLLPINDS